jgi:hypothetical protein
MKKIVMIFSALSLITFNVYAKPQVCPFVDYFTVNAPYGSMISKLDSNGNIYASLSDPLHFTTFCKDKTSSLSGNAYVTVSMSAVGACHLQVLDGPYEMNPSVIGVYCDGKLKYIGMDHEWGGYTYNLKFL